MATKKSRGTKKKRRREAIPSNSEQTAVQSPELAADEVYACICGFQERDKTEFNRHLMFSAQRDGKGTHKSLGRIDANTGEVLYPPWHQRTDKDRKRTCSNPIQNQNQDAEDAHTKDTEDPHTKDTEDAHTKRGQKGGDGRGAPSTNLADAQQIRVIPRVYTMDYTPIMRAAQEAAQRFWGWRRDMPLGNFLDTCLYLFFEEKGITLCGYYVDEKVMEQLEKEVPHAS